MKGPQEFYDFLLMIPLGKVTTYACLSQVFQVHPRTIASRLHSNPLPEIYPCYKVIHQSGKIGGYALGKEIKIKKLLADGVTIKNDTIDPHYIFDFLS